MAEPAPKLLDGSGQGDIGEWLYAKREKIHPREVHGLYAGLRIAAACVLLGVFYGLPWLRWEGHQAVVFDLPARKFYLFGLTFWPQDFVYLAALLVLAGLSLFFFTALAGRLWCGYACPQTVWTEVFLWIERLFEGDRAAQMKLDRAPRSARKLRIKAFKHGTWILFSAYTGFTFVAYFTPMRELWAGLTSLSLGPWESFWIVFYGFATYGNAGWMREQVCLYMCPYARFQSAMFDRDTLIIGYDPRRGEPRGSRGRGSDPRAQGLGDCIDCRMCVQVCPTGIDIRKGLQYECIGCGACIDACDRVMDKMAYPAGLIRYATESGLEGRPVRVFRPRVLIYGLLLVGLLGAFAYALSQRVPLGLDVIRDRKALFRERAGRIENVYTLKVLNMDERPHRYELHAEGIRGLDLSLDGPIEAEAGAVVEVPVRLMAEESHLESRSTPVKFVLIAADDDRLSAREEARFLGPPP